MTRSNQVVFIVFTMIGLAIAKYYMKELDITQINTVLMSILTGMGVMHMSDVKKKE